jgi:outer membrane protein assembly factor BamA
VLALAAVVSFTAADGGPAPFYLQSTLGGSRTLRGLGSYRLRGPVIVHGATEYRWHVHKWIELAGFLDVGSASRSLRAIAADTVIVTPGAGIRILSKTKRIVRFDWGHGPDGHRFIITVDGPY